MGKQTAGSRARQSGKPEAEVKAVDEIEERGQRTLYVDGEPHAVLALNDLSWGEMAELEDYMGSGIALDLETVLTSLKATLFIYYLSRRREDPEFTLAEAESTPIVNVSRDAPAEGSDGPPTSEGGA